MADEMLSQGAAQVAQAAGNRPAHRSSEEPSKAGSAFDQYQMLYDDYRETRNERVSYNQYFLALLFVQTLVAVLTALLSNNVMNVVGYAKMLLTFIFATAAVISLAWALKLLILQKIIGAQNETLRGMENDPTLSIPYKMLQTSWDKLKIRKYKAICRTNYYILPLALCAIFVALAILTNFGIVFPAITGNATATKDIILAY